MRVKKRDGSLVDVRVDEITDRIKSLCYDLDESIDPFRITQTVVSRIHDGISTSELDSFTADICAGLSITHPHFGILAARLIVSDHHKKVSCQTGLDFTDICKALFNNKDQMGNPCPLLNDTIMELCKTKGNKLNAMIDLERDFLIDYFGFKTLQRAYLLRVNQENSEQLVIEAPQHMFLRVALGIHGTDLEKVKETYDLMSTKHFTHATPTLYNSGTRRPQMFSCFLYKMEDSVDGIFKCLTDTAHISKWSGGIGIHISEIRGNGSYIRGTAGKSDGIVPMLKVYNDTARYINQSGRRLGSFAMYIEPWHPDIVDFLKCKLPHGTEERRARDLFYALWVNDLFMERVETDAEWCLMCPSECPGLTDAYGDKFKDLYTKYEKEGRYKSKIRARKLWDRIIDTQIETGVPYITYKDAANKKSNQKNLGTIKSSNLCVAPETRILTKEGWYPIKELKDKDIEVWNGEQWSRTTVKQTGANQALIKVTLSNGSVINCTPYHKFPIYTESQGLDYKMTKAKDLKEGVELIYHDLPQLYSNSLKILRNKITYWWKTLCNPTPFSSYIKGWYRLRLSIEDGDIFTKLRWLEGLVDSIYNMKDDYEDDDYFVDIYIDDLKVDNNEVIFLDIQLILQSLGIYHNRSINNIRFRFEDISVLGFKPKTKFLVGTPYHIVLNNLGIVSVQDEKRTDDTYCFTEPLKNMGMFEGVLLGNCAEIIEYSDTKKYACCVLASLVLPTFVYEETRSDGKVRSVFDHKKLYDVVKIVTKNLDKAIDINYYPVKETKISNMSERPLGIGVQGLADVFFKMRCAYDSQRASTLNREIFETIYFAALTASNELAKEKGTYPSYKNSPMSKGKFQFDLWLQYPTTPDKKLDSIKLNKRWDWEDLRNKIKEYGTRNSLLTALMPTASTSQIMGSAAEAFEPITSNIYSRRTLAGEFAVINQYLANDLVKLGIWDSKMKNKILRNRGSIQNIDEIPDNLKKLYKTVWEIKQKVLIDLSADRGQFIDQSQSLNLFFETPTYKNLSAAHFYGWKKGLKTGSYYIRSKPAIASESFTVQDNSDDNEDIQQDTYGYDVEDIQNLQQEYGEECEACGS